MLQRQNPGYAVFSCWQAVWNSCRNSLELHMAEEVGSLLFVREERINAVYRDVLKTLQVLSILARLIGEFCSCTTYSRCPSSLGCSLFSG